MPASPSFPGLRGSQRVLFLISRYWRQEGRDDFELEVLLVTVAVGSLLEDTDLIVEPLHQAGADLVFRVIVLSDAVPLKGFFPVGCGDHVVSLSAQGHFYSFAEHSVIISDYNFRHLFVPSSRRALSPGRNPLSAQFSPVRRLEVIFDAGEFTLQR